MYNYSKNNNQPTIIPQSTNEEKYTYKLLPYLSKYPPSTWKQSFTVNMENFPVYLENSAVYLENATVYLKSFIVYLKSSAV